MSNKTSLQEITQRILDNEKSLRKKAKLYVQVGIGFSIFVAVYLTFITAQIRKVDAQAISEFARLEIQNQLPEAASSLQAHLESQAPALVGSTFQTALDALPQLRETFSEQIAAIQKDAVSSFEQTLVEVANEAIRSSKEGLDEIENGQTDAEKLELLMDTVAEQIRKEAADALNALYPTYAGEIAKMKAFLVDLQEDDVRLTPKEREQKNVIESLLQLIARAAQEYGNENLFGAGLTDTLTLTADGE